MLFHNLLRDGANRNPDQPCFHWVDRDKGLDYAGAVTAMDQVAGGLAHLGVRAGDRVTIFAHNGLDYLVSMFGCWRIGAISALVNVKFADELDLYFADHTPRAVIFTHDMIAPVRAAAAKLDPVPTLICMDGPMQGAMGLAELMAAGLAVPACPSDETAIAHLSYTSGTTGRPKGACLRHEPTLRASKCIAERLRITASDVSFGPSALSSSYQLVGNLLPQLSRGASINVMGKWTAETGFDAVEARKATMLIANPPILNDLLVEARRRERVPAGLRFGVSGGGPVPPQLKIDWHDHLGLPLVESYGQSELGGFVALGLPQFDPAGLNNRRSGPALPDKEVRILSQGGDEVPIGTVGEIAITGGCMAGYWGMPEKTKEAVRGAWLWTGDLGSMDAEGYITMRGRRSELLQVAGVDWFPRDLEEALGAQPGIVQAAVVGVADGRLGQRPVAFVQTDDEIDAADLKAKAGAAVIYDLAPLEIVALPELPMTPTGKIAKAELASRARAAAAT